MKNKVSYLIGIAVLGLAMVSSVHGQTNPVPVDVPEADRQDRPTADTTSSTSKLEAVGHGLRDFFTDNKSYFSNKTVIVEAGALYNQQTGVGGFLDVQLPVANQASVGFASAILNHKVYTASLATRLGTTWQVPVLGPVYSYIESGPAINLDHPDELLAQSFAGGVWKVALSPKWELTAGAAVGKITGIPGAVYGAGVSVGYAWGN